VLPGEGSGPGLRGDQFDSIVENEFLHVTDTPLSTFSIDTDTASYSKIRSYLRDFHQMPQPGMVRIEELINYFSYNYAGPDDERPFAAHLAAASCPWNAEHRLVRVALKGREIDPAKRPASNLVFLLDVSGSMDQPNKFPLMVQALKLLTQQLTENDRVAIVVYAGAAGLVLDSTTGDRPQEIEAALDRLRAGGSTNGGEGITLAYQHALDHFIKGGTNRVILCTDGDFNVGTTSTDALVTLVAEQAKAGVFLTVLGFGTGNLNDALLEQISNRGNGNYAFVDTLKEARKVLVEQIASTMVVLAKDVKIQVEFNPNRVASYRLLGYENRVMAARDFNDDKKDAGEIGPGHTVTALYEIVPVTAEGKNPSAAESALDPLKYQSQSEPTDAALSDELLTLKLRYKAPEADQSQLVSFTLTDTGASFAESDRDLQFAAAVAAFGMVLRDSKFKGNATLPAVLELAQAAYDASDPGSEYRQELIELVRQAMTIVGQ
jgi:Ca-activated chloride channel family protein